MSKDWIPVTNDFGETAKLEAESFVVEETRDSVHHAYVALADDCKVGDRSAMSPTDRTYEAWPTSQVESIGSPNESLGWFFESISEQPFDVDEYLRKRNYSRPRGANR